MLSLEEQDIIEKFGDKDSFELALILNKQKNIDGRKIAQQIESRKKMKDKAPQWCKNKAIFFPYGLSLEQGSSETTAAFKANLIEGKIIDITGGMGMDSWGFSLNKKNKIRTFEQNENLFEISKYNHQVLNTEVEWKLGDGMEFILKEKLEIDWIFADPDRRGISGQKLYKLADCQPNIVELIKEKPDLNYLFKLSPMLDIEQSIKELEGVQKIWVIIFKGEVKEILIRKTKEKSFDPPIEIIELKTNKPPLLIYSGKKSMEKEKKKYLGGIGKYLYEPHVGILKAGFFKQIQNENLWKLGIHTHLYSSNMLMEDFKGKIFEICYSGKFEKGKVEEILGKKIEIIQKNFPLTPNEIYKKLGLKPGGDHFLYCYRNQFEKLEMAICKRI
ncbi:MAG: hypothetical protein RIR51_1351 [Bacteroidota bacterium]|jgi:hypothetical protein